MSKRARGIVMLMLALAAGLAATLFAMRWMKTQSKSDSRIVVAAADVDIGAKLAPDMLRLVEWPSGSVPPGAFAEPAALQGRVLKTALARGEPVLEAKLAPQGTKGGLSAVVLEGKRAMTVRVNDVIGVAGFALPGNYVDIMVNTRTPARGTQRDDQDKSISKIVLERILVLAVAQEANRDDTKPKVVNAVTLELSPEQAEVLDLARSVGTLSLVLRNQIDPQPGGTTGATKDTLLGGMPLQPVSLVSEASAPPVRAQPPAVRRPAAPTPSTQPPPAPAAQACVEVIRGATRSRECF